MKALTKLFVAVAALFIGFACTTDTTEDLGGTIVTGGQSTLVLSLEESRTQLGEKADEVYPLYWSEGDQILVNGLTSHPLTEAAEGQESAAFSFDGTLTLPYNLVYPAPAEGVVAVTEGCVPVTFLATDLHCWNILQWRSTNVCIHQGSCRGRGGSAYSVAAPHRRSPLRCYG